MRLPYVLAASMALLELHLWNWSMSGRIFLHHSSFIDDITHNSPSSKWISTNGGRATAIPREETYLWPFDLAAERV